MLLSFDGTDACDPGHQRSFDAASNLLASGGPSSGGVSEHLDYIIVINRRAVQVIESAVIPLRSSVSLGKWKGADLFDVSDHYPVRAVIQF